MLRALCASVVLCVLTFAAEDGTNPHPDDDGQSGDNNTPTTFTLQVSVVLIPTLNEWGLMALALVLGGLGLVALRRRRPVRG